MPKKNCLRCKHKTEVTESQLYCADWPGGDMILWCKAYNMDIDWILSRDPQLTKCNKFEVVE